MLLVSVVGVGCARDGEGCGLGLRRRDNGVIGSRNDPATESRKRVQIMVVVVVAAVKAIRVVV